MTTEPDRAGELGVIGLFHRIAAALEQELKPALSQARLSKGEFELLKELREADDDRVALTPGQLATRTLISSGAVTKQIDRLVAAGWVSRSVCVDDGRVRRVALTPSGKALIDAVVSEHAALEENLLESLSELDRARLLGLLTRWGQGLGA